MGRVHNDSMNAKQRAARARKAALVTAKVQAGAPKDAPEAEEAAPEVEIEDDITDVIADEDGFRIVDADEDDTSERFG